MDSLPLDYGAIRLVADAIFSGQYASINHDSERKLASSDTDQEVLLKLLTVRH